MFCEVAGEWHEVLWTLNERREAQHVAGEPRVQIAPEIARPHTILDVFLHGSDESKVNASGLLVAEALHLSGVQHPQQLRLTIQRQLMQLVKEEGTAVSGGNEPLAVNGIRIRSAPRPEQQPLDQVLRERAAVEIHDPPAPATPGMDVLGEHFLAGTGFAHKKNRVRTRRDSAC
ncbi:MAG TPA: hypothetical protein VK573_02970 [Gemmatimonadales bacterium]|nr:hypothetical protein [Gemmatimonadales bacterium]